MAKTSQTVKLTKRTVEAATPLPTPTGIRQKLYLDTELRGFGLCVGAQSKTFFAQRDVRGRTVRVTIGPYPVFTVDTARREAQQLLAKMAAGRNPVEEKRRERARGITLASALALYQQTLEAKGRSPRTIENFQYNIETYLKDWLPRPLAELTRADVRARHRKVADDVAAGRYARGQKRSEGDGRTTANGVMISFRSIYNRALREHEYLPPNPTINVDWFKLEPRKAALPLSRLHLWWQQVQEIENPIHRDYLAVTLYTGLRRGNAASIRPEHIDFDNQSLHIPKPKSGRPFDLPLSDFLVELLQARMAQNREVFGNDCPWLFPAASRSGHIEEPHHEFDGLPWSVHDLRRWFITVAESLDLSPYAVKQLVNHALPASDITAIYVQSSLERLRAPMQAITNKLRVLCNSPSKPITLPTRTNQAA